MGCRGGRGESGAPFATGMPRGDIGGEATACLVPPMLPNGRGLAGRPCPGGGGGPPRSFITSSIEGCVSPFTAIGGGTRLGLSGIVAESLPLSSGLGCELCRDLVFLDKLLLSASC